MHIGPSPRNWESAITSEWRINLGWAGERRRFFFGIDIPNKTATLYATQREVLDSVLRVTGDHDKNWTVNEVNVAQMAKGIREDPGGNPKDRRILFGTICRQGYGGDYNDKVVNYRSLSMNLDEVIRVLFTSCLLEESESRLRMTGFSSLFH
jgi:hypothetical protein